MAIDVKDLLRKARAGDLRDWTSSAIRLPNGTVLENVQVDTPQDAQVFAHALEALCRVAPMVGTAAAPPPAASGPGLSERIQLFLAQFGQRKLSAKVGIDTQWSLRLFEAVVGDVLLSSIGRTETDAFLATLAVERDEAEGISRAVRAGNPREGPERVEGAADRLAHEGKASGPTAGVLRLVRR